MRLDLGCLLRQETTVIFLILLPLVLLLNRLILLLRRAKVLMLAGAEAVVRALIEAGSVKQRAVGVEIWGAQVVSLQISVVGRGLFWEWEHIERDDEEGESDVYEEEENDDDDDDF